MRKRKVYKPPSPKDPGPPPSEIATNNLEKLLRRATGAYYDISPDQDIPASKPWIKKKGPGIVMRISNTLFFTPKHKKSTP